MYVYIIVNFSLIINFHRSGALTNCRSVKLVINRDNVNTSRNVNTIVYMFKAVRGIRKKK